MVMKSYSAGDRGPVSGGGNPGPEIEHSAARRGFTRRALRHAIVGVAAAVAAALLADCATVRELTALRQVDFAFSHIEGARVAGVTLKPGLHYTDLGITDMARLTGALRSSEMPMELTVHVRAENPIDNRVTARLVDLDWMLFVEDRQTLAGSVEDTQAMPPGTQVDLPITVRFDLLGFGNRGARDLFDLALGISGLGGTPRDLRFELRPTIETSLGPVEYPRPVVIRKSTLAP